MSEKRNFSAIVRKGELAFVSYCLELGVTSQGKTEDEALENLREAISLYIEDEDVKKTLGKLPERPPHLTTLAVMVD
ncbi:type II toxin-antitoxin system HicB family antitoxin [archaeon]|nr:type II toxin-antitoxin system HicB family antitoxin [archaeon]